MTIETTPSALRYVMFRYADRRTELAGARRLDILTARGRVRVVQLELTDGNGSVLYEDHSMDPVLDGWRAIGARVLAHHLANDSPIPAQSGTVTVGVHAGRYGNTLSSSSPVQHWP